MQQIEKGKTRSKTFYHYQNLFRDLKTQRSSSINDDTLKQYPSSHFQQGLNPSDIIQFLQYQQIIAFKTLSLNKNLKYIKYKQMIVFRLQDYHKSLVQRVSELTTKNQQKIDILYQQQLKLNKKRKRKTSLIQIQSKQLQIKIIKLKRNLSFEHKYCQNCKKSIKQSIICSFCKQNLNKLQRQKINNNCSTPKSYYLCKSPFHYKKNETRKNNFQRMQYKSIQYPDYSPQFNYNYEKYKYINSPVNQFDCQSGYQDLQIQSKQSEIINNPSNISAFNKNGSKFTSPSTNYNYNNHSINSKSRESNINVKNQYYQTDNLKVSNIDISIPQEQQYEFNNYQTKTTYSFENKQTQNNASKLFSSPFIQIKPNHNFYNSKSFFEGQLLQYSNIIANNKQQNINKIVTNKCEICCICQSVIPSNMQAQLLPCNHIFHTKCINNFTNPQPLHKCPKCRGKRIK